MQFVAKAPEQSFHVLKAGQRFKYHCPGTGAQWLETHGSERLLIRTSGKFSLVSTKSGESMIGPLSLEDMAADLNSSGAAMYAPLFPNFPDDGTWTEVKA